ncbi:MAG: SLC13 family permease [Erysipelotrichaceae bacterium]|nr:SLC13 family permease [Erysipelotrichaceae bacterium]
MSLKFKGFGFKHVIEIISIVLGIFLATRPGNESLSAEAFKILGITLWGVTNFALGLAPFYATGLLMCALWFVSGAVPAGTIFSGFAGTTFWLIIGCMNLAAAVKKSGLLKRLTLLCLKYFKPTYGGQIIAIILVGTLISPLIPATVAKVAIMGGLVYDISEELELPKRGIGRFGMLLALWLGFNISGNYFLSGAFQAYMVKSAMPPESQAVYTWMTWFIRSLPWSITMIVLYYLFIRFFFNEKSYKEITKDYIVNKLKALGDFSRDEKVTVVVMVCALISFMLERVTGISSMVTALVAMSVLNFFKVLTAKEFINDTAWHLVIFYGIALGMGAVFSSVGITEWLVSTASPYMQGLSNPYLFVTVLCAMIYVVRIFLDQITTNTMVVGIVVPFATALGFDPFVAAVVVYGCSVVFYPMYVHPTMLVALGTLGGEENVDMGKAPLADVAYMVVNWLGFLACVPLWKLFGMC